MSKKKNTPKDGFESVEGALTKTEQYIEENRKSLTIIILAIAIVVGGYMAYKKYYIEPKESQAQEEMYLTERLFERDSFQLALEGDGYGATGFDQIIDDYSGTKSANLAYYYAGICYLRLGQFDEAIEHLEKFDGNDRIVSAIALGATGDAYVELGEHEKGASYYEKAATLNDNEFISPLYFLKAGVVYEELGDFKNALSVYEKIKKDFPLSDEGREIDKYISAAKKNL